MNRLLGWQQRLKSVGQSGIRATASGLSLLERGVRRQEEEQGQSRSRAEIVVVATVVAMVDVVGLAVVVSVVVGVVVVVASMVLLGVSMSIVLFLPATIFISFTGTLKASCESSSSSRRIWHILSERWSWDD